MRELIIFNAIFHPVYWFLLFPFLKSKYPDLAIIFVIIPISISIFLSVYFKKKKRK